MVLEHRASLTPLIDLEALMRKIKSVLTLIALLAAVAVVTVGSPAKAYPPDPCFDGW